MKKAPDDAAVRSALNWKARDNNNDNDLIFFRPRDCDSNHLQRW